MRRCAALPTVTRLLAALALAAAALAALAAAAHASDPDKYGIETVGASLSTTQAGAHPDFTTTIALKTDPSEPTSAGLKPPYARTRDLAVTIPPGLLGDPASFPQCTVSQLEERACPIDSQVGVTEVSVYLLSTFNEPVYLMKPPAGADDVVVRLGFIAGVFPEVLNVRVRPEAGYGIEARLEGANAAAQLVRAVTTLWGVPTDPSHDPERVTPEEAGKGELPPGGSRESGLRPTAFMTNPTRCGGGREVSVTTDSYQRPGVFSTMSAPLPAITGCGRLSFAPRISLAPTSAAADSPSGIDATLSLDQQGLTDPGALATAHLKRAVVALPPGMAMNPAAAAGLGACTEAQVGLISESPPRFDDSPAACPAAAKVGTAQIKTPVLADPIEGSLYLAAQGQNPFHTLLAGYLVARGGGVLVKLAGRFEVDPASGQITAVFDENPEQPFEELRLRFKGGSHGVLTTPDACGAYAIHSALSPWSAADPFAPLPSEVSESSSEFQISSGPEGGSCPAGGFSPGLEAGAASPIAGAFSPFIAKLARRAGEQNLSGFELTLPEGMLAKLKGVELCPQADTAAASCPGGSLLGSARVAVGSGPSPLWLPEPGRESIDLYLAGPYKQAPYSLIVRAPAQAGPFDLGTVVVREALYVNPRTAQVTVKSDPLPQVLQGVPVDYRTIYASVDRPEFTLNPTSCRSKQVAANLNSAQGKSAEATDSFQVASCASLAFKPKMTLRLQGGTRRTAHPKLIATVRSQGIGVAGLRRIQVKLPRSAFLDNAHIRTICTRVQFAAGAGNGARCPKGSIYGRAWVKTPLFDYRLSGNVYLRSSNHKLPDLVLALHGPGPVPVAVELAGKTDSVKGALRNTFTAVPDAPFEKARVVLFGGRRGLVVNSRNLCAAKQRANVRAVGQNGKSTQLRPLVRNGCGKAKHKRHGGHREAKRRVRGERRAAT